MDALGSNIRSARAFIVPALVTAPLMTPPASVRVPGMGVGVAGAFGSTVLMIFPFRVPPMVVVPWFKAVRVEVRTCVGLIVVDPVMLVTSRATLTAPLVWVTLWLVNVPSISPLTFAVP